MYSEWLLYDGKKTIQNTNVPVKVIVAENGAMQYGKNYYRYANQPKELSVIKKAGHMFDEEGTEQKFFQETLNWIKKF
jgi:pimeloyl-ACP methyl ester carboxylesterase